jgi:hypothetical protein
MVETESICNVNVNDALKDYGEIEVKLTAHIKGKRELSIRLWIGIRLLKLASWVMNDFAEVIITRLNN